MEQAQKNNSREKHATHHEIVLDVYDTGKVKFEEHNRSMVLVPRAQLCSLSTGVLLGHVNL